jgi:hypothetical protein
MTAAPESAEGDIGIAPRLPPWRRACSVGCVLWGAGVAIVLSTVFIILGLATGGDDGGSAGAGGFNAGPATGYAFADVNEFDEERLFLVRLPDGEFRAFSNLSARQQELGGSCRIYFDEAAQPGNIAQVTGMRGAFIEDCENTRTVWRVDGVLAFGAGYGDLDRFPVNVDQAGDLRIDTSERTCTRSKGVPGIPPFETRTCQGSP